MKFELRDEVSVDDQKLSNLVPRHTTECPVCAEKFLIPRDLKKYNRHVRECEYRQEHTIEERKFRDFNNRVIGELMDCDEFSHAQADAIVSAIQTLINGDEYA